VIGTSTGTGVFTVEEKIVGELVPTEVMEFTVSGYDVFDVAANPSGDPNVVFSILPAVPGTYAPLV
jgi:hypothetical protein